MGLFDAFRRRETGGANDMRARLEGAMSRRRLRGWQPPLENINSLVASGGPRLLARARELVVTNGYAANACEAYAANLIGDGMKPSSLIEDPDLRDRVQRLWLAWTDEADTDGLTDFYGLQAMVAREMFVAGECFVRLRPRRAEDGLLVPMQLQLLQSEMLPFEKVETAPNGNRIRCGIEFDLIGRRVAYHFRRRHPGDSTDRGDVTPETARVPAEDVLHVWGCGRRHHWRGGRRGGATGRGGHTIGHFADSAVSRHIALAVYRRGADWRQRHHLCALGRLAQRAALMGALITWLTGGATTASSRFALAVGKWAAIGITVLLFLLSLRRSGERAGRLAELIENTEKVNEIQRKMLEAAARRPRDRDELVECLRDGEF
jgi:Phage portal protein, lambda family